MTLLTMLYDISSVDLNIQSEVSQYSLNALGPFRFE